MNPSSLGLGPSTPLSVGVVSLNLMLTMALSLLLGWHFRRHGSTFSNRAKFARVLPTMALTTALVISVVKASLALSLGLVGALSIVRFRTPVKEPEELAYLFMAIAIGVGMGADHRFVTVTAILLILGLLWLRSVLGRGSKYPNLYLNVQVPQDADESHMLEALLALLARYAERVDMRRFDVHDGSVEATFYLDCPSTEGLVAAQEEVRAQFPGSSVTFVEQSSMPGA